jgi:predicted alpha/beta-hydrolase family hydrolase
LTDFLFDGPEDARVTILLAHGAGAPMDSASMTAATKSLAEAGFRVARFEFGYMAGRRTGERKPPPRADKVMPEYAQAITDLKTRGPLIIGGRSMGGRVASMVADDEFAKGRIRGVLCLGYPFHPPGRPEQLRTAHLERIKCPVLIVQGTRDEFGVPDEVTTYPLSKQVRILWLEDGDHDLRPRKAISGFTVAQHLKTMADTVTEWTKAIA